MLFATMAMFIAKEDNSRYAWYRNGVIYENMA
jgi:hypothetical protein